MIFVSFFISNNIAILIIKDTVSFLMNLIMKSRKSNVLYYGQAVFSLSRIHSLDFPQCVVISYSHNKNLQLFQVKQEEELMSAAYAP